MEEDVLPPLSGLVLRGASGLGDVGDEILHTPRRSPQASSVAPIGSPGGSGGGGEGEEGEEGLELEGGLVGVYAARSPSSSSAEVGVGAHVRGGGSLPLVGGLVGEDGREGVLLDEGGLMDGGEARGAGALSLGGVGSGGGEGRFGARMWASPGEGLQRSRSLQSQVHARVEQPIEGVDVEPHILVRDGAGSVLDHRETTSVEWERSRGFAGCSWVGCPSMHLLTGTQRAQADEDADDLDALDPAANAHAGVPRPAFQCLQALALGRENRSTFCCDACLVGGWGAHRSFLLNDWATDHARTATASSTGPPSRSSSSSSASSSSASSSLAEGATRATDGSAALEGLLALRRVARPEPAAAGWERVTVARGQRAWTPSAVDAFRRLRVKTTTMTATGGGSDGKEALVRAIRIVSSHVLPLPPKPPVRVWDVLQNHPLQFATPPMHARAATTVRVVSYNVLAEILATVSQYPYCDRWFLAFSYRRLLLGLELQAVGADVVCLQEVQRDHYTSFFQPLMRRLGFDGVHHSKTRAPVGTIGKIDGCAIFWNARRVEMLETHPVEFRRLAEAAEAAENAKPMSQTQRRNFSARMTRLKRDNIAIIGLFRLVASPSGAPLGPAAAGAGGGAGVGAGGGGGGGEGGGARFVVTNTHLFWDPQYADVKLWQTMQLLEQLERFLQAQGGSVPLIVCGDFNSEPRSAVHQLIGNNARSGRRIPLRAEDLPPDPTQLLPPPERIWHNLLLASSYAVLQGNNEPAYTNFTHEFRGTLDYIWFSPDSITPTATLRIPTEETLQAFAKCPLPNAQFPSDHICLAADLVLGQPFQRIVLPPAAPAVAPAPPPESYGPPAAYGYAEYGYRV